MIEKKAYRGASIQRWVVFILERQQRFSNSACDNMMGGLRQAAEAMGMSSSLASFIRNLPIASRSQAFMASVATLSSVGRTHNRTSSRYMSDEI